MAGVHPVQVAHRALGHDTVRLDLADHPGDGPAQIETGGDPPVVEAEEVQNGHSDDLGRRPLLVAADPGHLVAGDGVVEATGLAVGDQAIDHLVTLRGQPGRGASAAEVEVVGVGGDVQEAEWCIHRPRRYRATDRR